MDDCNQPVLTNNDNYYMTILVFNSQNIEQIYPSSQLEWQYSKQICTDKAIASEILKNQSEGSNRMLPSATVTHSADVQTTTAFMSCVCISSSTGLQHLTAQTRCHVYALAQVPDCSIWLYRLEWFFWISLATTVLGLANLWQNLKELHGSWQGLAAS